MRNTKFLTATQIENFYRDGFLIVENFVETDLCHLLMQRANELIQDFNPEDIVKTIFSTKDQSHAKNQYFLESGDKIGFFFEEGAINEKGELTTNKATAINKIGHALHDVDPIFSCFSRMSRLAAVAEDLGMPDPLLLQSMYICKQPFIGGEVTCHQDSTYLYVEDQPCMGLWFALEDATLQNGCMWAIPGGHRTPLKSRMRRNANDEVSFEVYDHSPWELDKMVPLEVPQGGLVVLHGLLPHMSKENVSARSRNAYTLHIISGKHHYPADNWLHRPENMPLRGFV